MDRRCLVFQNDGRILLATAHPAAQRASDDLRGFAELAASSGEFHTYRVTDVSLWAAAASGLTSAQIIDTLRHLGQHLPPAPLVARIQEFVARYGLLRLTGAPGDLSLTSSDQALLSQLAGKLDLRVVGGVIPVVDGQRGVVKSQMAALGYPVVDDALLDAFTPIEFQLRPEIRLRPYQETAVDRFVAAKSGGVVLLPCGSGKTVVGVAAAARLGARTLVITPSRTIGDQWREHFLTLTNLDVGDITTYARRVETRPVTIATYQALTKRTDASHAALAHLLDYPWGLIIYDEVHSLPADVFRQSAAMQSRRRLGLTATLVREDGRERDVFSLVGPPVFSTPWKALERQGWIAPVDCVELRVTLPTDRTATADRILASKLRVTRALVERNPQRPTLVAAHRLIEVAALSKALGVPAVTGDTPLSERAELYERFRRGDLRCLVLSRVANVGVDLPDASVLIQVSGTFGSRQEEAQRVGRLLRPKENGRRAVFYSLVANGTPEVALAARRQRFLIDQGYHYEIRNA